MNNIELIRKFIFYFIKSKLPIDRLAYIHSINNYEMSMEYFEKVHSQYKKEQEEQEIEWSKEKKILEEKIGGLGLKLKEYENRQKELRESQNVLVNELISIDNSGKVNQTNRMIVVYSDSKKDISNKIETMRVNNDNDDNIRRVVYV